MQRCLQLAKQAFGSTRSNPMVGAVLVKDGAIIAEGYHQLYGQGHAEAHAIAAAKNHANLKGTTLYVNLEPCSHFGKTPPCADLVIASGIQKIVIGATDPNPKVSGGGIARLKEAGCNVKVGILQKECRELNKRFYTYHEKKRPWVLLKWAQSADGYIAKSSAEQTWISGSESRTLVHKWRSEEMAILVGTNTARTDNPLLTARLYAGGCNPTRILLDRNLTLPTSLNIFNSDSKTIIFSEKQGLSFPPNIEVVRTIFDQSLIDSICKELHTRNIISCMIEGGAKTLAYWIDSNLWDEARIFTSAVTFNAGVKAPVFKGALIEEQYVGADSLKYYRPD